MHISVSATHVNNVRLRLVPIVTTMVLTAHRGFKCFQKEKVQMIEK